MLELDFYKSINCAKSFAAKPLLCSKQQQPTWLALFIIIH